MWIVIDIGCLDCQLESRIVGVFDDETEAKGVADVLDEEHGGASDRAFKVFPLPEVGVIDPDYVESFKA